MNAFEERIAGLTGGGLYGIDLQALQVNLGFRCNQQCRHCHVSASPSRTEMMSWPTMARVVAAAKSAGCELVDLTGGAPELNPDFRRFVAALREEGLNVQVRTNLTVLLLPAMRDLPSFFRDHQVRLVGSLPCYLEQNVQAQRGEGVYTKSIEAIGILNSLGYGIDQSLPLDLVYNPGGPFLPPDQSELESAYRTELAERWGIHFSRLLTITNMPIGKFRSELLAEDREANYLALLQKAFNPATLDGLMCRHQVSIGWDGTLYDCDFNLALGFAVNHGVPDHIDRFDASALASRRIVTGEHCTGCTAGQGSSCAGVLAGES